MLSPAVLAWLLVSVLASALCLVAAALGWRIARRWDPCCGDPSQVRMERWLPGIQAAMCWAVTLEILSLFFLVHLSDQISGLMTGAMCAAGTLIATPWGYAALGLRALAALLALWWLSWHLLDRRSMDQPLLRAKCGLLLPLALASTAGSLLGAMHLLGIDLQLVTSCCSSVFAGSTGSDGLGSLLAQIAPQTGLWMFFGGWAVLAAGGVLWRRWPWVALGSALLAAALVLMGIVSAVSLYVYALPTHHCPFCLLQSGEAFIGYGWYGPLLLGMALVLSLGSTHLLVPASLRQRDLDAVLRRMQWLLWAAAALGALLGAQAVLGSELRMF